MKYEYSDIPSNSEKEAREEWGKLDFKKYTKSDKGDIAKMERILDARPGVLPEKEGYFLERYTCLCGRNLTFFDFVFTALVDAGHSKSFVLHTLIGTKYIINKARIVRCSNCAELSTRVLRYGQNGCYLCPK